MEKLWRMRAAPDAPACLSHRRKTLRDADTMTRAAQALMRLHRAMQMRDRERMPIEALTLCCRCHLPEVATNRAEQVTMRAGTGYPIARIVSSRRVAERGGLGTERIVVIYGMSRRWRGRKSQHGAQGRDSVACSAHEATNALREQQVPRMKQSASYAGAMRRSGSHPHRQPASYRRNNPLRHMFAAVVHVA
ncbi:MULTISPECIES: hypothetical protein [unclassified Burkholderia]|uniref:hypothetical protein n=1 Tax=unclassified Burkholderia TaxID=2613784 RepID=UPI002AB16696|nr:MULTISPECIES: hypothetical protein [unclassified Burkholderia]